MLDRVPSRGDIDFVKVNFGNNFTYEIHEDRTQRDNLLVVWYAAVHLRAVLLALWVIKAGLATLKALVQQRLTACIMADRVWDLSRDM